MKNVLITGCSTGIGRALAHEFHHQGYRVWATARNPESLSELSSQGMQTARLDVTEDEDIHSVIRMITDSDGAIDILVNNAGYGAMGPLTETPKSELVRQFDTNVFAPVSLSNAVVPYMREKGSGIIINIGSISGVVTTPFSSVYCASKAAFNSLSDAMRMELKPFGIDVLTVQPGAIQSCFASNATTALEGVLSGDSAYLSIEDALRERANASQKHPTTAESCARTIVNRAVSGNASGVLRVGNGSRALPALKAILPTSWFEGILGRVFKLNRLKG